MQMEYDYKCVPVPQTIATGTAGKDSHSTAVDAYQTIIKREAQGGWELHMADEIVSYQKGSCCLCCKKEAETMHFKLLVFKKAKS
jgi:hypothetical protein